MILIDFSQVAVSNLHQQVKGTEEPIIEPDLLRHMILSSIRKIKRRFGSQYGQVVLCVDSQNYWRKELFPNYKYNRKKLRDKSKINWPLFFSILGELREEIRQYFPYKVMLVDRAEADDIIGTLAKHFHIREEILIVSGDKDFQQLQVFPNVLQYAPIQDTFLRPDDPILFLKEHIIRGDDGDGVPNFLSGDNVFRIGEKQKSIFAKKVDIWLTQKPEEFCADKTILRNYYRNKVMVDLSHIPADVESEILEEFDVPIMGNVNKIYGYLVKHRMKNLLDHIQDF